MTISLNGSTGISTPADNILGNLTFSGTGNRILGDFSNATVTNRVAFQTSTANANTHVYAIPNGSATNAGFFATSNFSDTANYSFGGFRIDSAGADFKIWSDRAGTGTYLPMTFYTGGIEQLRIGTNGNIGIGITSSASNKIQISGNLTSSTGVGRTLIVAGTIPATATTEYAIFYSTPSTESAAFTLPSLTHYYATQGGIGYGGSVVTNQYGFYADSFLTAATNNYGFYSAIPAATGRFNFYAAGTAVNYFAGKVGVSTNNPSNTLHVNGGISIQNGPVYATAGAGLELWYNTSLNTGELIAYDRTNSVYKILDLAGSYVTLSTGGTERVRADASGNVGIAATPAAWGADTRALQIYNRSSFCDLQSYTQITNNAYWNGSNWLHLQTAPASNMYMNLSGGHVWRGAASGTAGAVVGWVQTASLDVGGNFTATGNVGAYSDERLKTDWATLDKDIIKILANVKNGTYTRIDTKQRQVGVSAQSLQVVMPEAVSEAEDGTLSVAYGNAALALCVELAKKIVELEARLDAK